MLNFAAYADSFQEWHRAVHRRFRESRLFPTRAPIDFHERGLRDREHLWRIYSPSTPIRIATDDYGGAQTDWVLKGWVPAEPRHGRFSAFLLRRGGWPEPQALPEKGLLVFSAAVLVHLAGTARALIVRIRVSHALPPVAVRDSNKTTQSLCHGIHFSVAEYRSDYRQSRNRPT